MKTLLSLALAALAQSAAASAFQFQPAMPRAIARPLPMVSRVATPFAIPLSQERVVVTRPSIQLARLRVSRALAAIRAAEPADVRAERPESKGSEFDGSEAIHTPPAPVPVSVAHTRRVTLPEQDLEDEIGIGIRR